MPARDLTRFQLLIWTGQKLHPEAPLYANAGYGVIDSAIDPDHYCKAVQALINKSDALRTLIVEQDGIPKQRVLATLSYEPELVDLSDHSFAEAKVDEWVKRRCDVPLDFGRQPFDFALLKLRENQYAIYSNFHHIISDATSAAIIEGLLSDYYELSLNGRLEDAPELPAFQSYVTDQLEHSDSPTMRKAESFWKRKLAEESEPIKFYGRSANKRTTRVERVTCHLGSERSAKLKTIAANKDGSVVSLVSVHHMFAALVSAFLYHIGDRPQTISLGLPFHNRRNRRETIGCLLQIIPLKLRIEEDDTFLSLLGRIGNSYLTILRHHEYHVGNPSHRQLYDVGFNYISSRPPQVLYGKPRIGKWLHSGHAVDTLHIHAYDNETDGFSLEFDFHCDIFDEQQRGLAIQQFLQLIDSVLENPEQPISELCLLSDRERRTILDEFNATDSPFPDSLTYDQLLKAEVERAPERIAVSAGEQYLTYSALNERVNSMAARLRTAGFGPDSLAAILSTRTINFLTAVLAVFRCGGAYTPLDPAYPIERVAYVLNRSKSSVCIVADEFMPAVAEALERIPSENHPLVLSMGDLLRVAQPPVGASFDGGPNRLAYVIYTSGSTGEPKGAMVEVKGMLNHLFAKITDLKISSEDVVAQVASQCSDISVWQFLAALLAGGRVVIMDDNTVREPGVLLKRVDEEGITILQLVPSQLRTILDALDTFTEKRPKLSSLRCLVIAGEVLGADACRRWLTYYPDVPIVNAYGPTECSDVVSHYWMEAASQLGERSVPIGHPLNNLRLYTLDSNWAITPIGVAGELYIGGAGVGRGYLNDPARTAQSFFPDPYSSFPGARAYKTGDLARYLPDGNLEYIGRNDYQVKIRGFRIELGEVESALARHPSVAQAVATARDHKSGGKTLVAYFVATPGLPPTPTQLRSFIKDVLPGHMVPSAFVLLKSMPLTPNGKINRKALPAPDPSHAREERVIVEATSQVEKTLAAIWAEVLGVERVGITDNFFDLGGDSILIVQVAIRANRSGVRLPPLDIFTYPTISELTAMMGSSQSIKAEQGLVEGPIPLTPAQQMFFEQDLPERHHYNQAKLVEIREPVDVEVLENAVKRLLEQHDALRLRFIPEASGWRQVNTATEENQVFSYEDLSAIPELDQKAAISSRASQLQSSLNLRNGPLLRAALFELGEGKRNRLLLIIHHLAVDGVSWRILMDDLQLHYSQIIRGQEIQPSAKGSSFRQWSRGLSEYAVSQELAKELSYWVELADSKTARLPLDFPAGENLLQASRTVSASLSVLETEALIREVPESYNVRINEVLMMALVNTLAEWSRETEHMIELEGHGREHIFDDLDISRTVGWFTTFFPVRFDISGADNSLIALKMIKEQWRRVPNRGIGYGILRYLSSDQQIKRRLESIPPCQVRFNYLGQFDQMFSADSMFGIAEESPGESSSRRGAGNYLLDINALVIGMQLQVDWTYCENIHRQSTIERLAQRFLKELSGLISQSQALRVKGYSPSDLVEFNWSEEDVDEIDSLLDQPAM
jgi:amino acid adenylation domain-containing protein/non-ribosomal peptide synthase protein (TIGR01720 family)